MESIQKYRQKRALGREDNLDMAFWERLWGLFFFLKWYLLGGLLCQKLSVFFSAIIYKKLIEVNDEHKFCSFYEKRLNTEVAADSLGKELKGYVVWISGGKNKEVFPTK